MSTARRAASKHEVAFEAVTSCNADWVLSPPTSIESRAAVAACKRCPGRVDCLAAVLDVEVNNLLVIDAGLLSIVVAEPSSIGEEVRPLADALTRLVDAASTHTAVDLTAAPSSPARRDAALPQRHRAPRTARRRVRKH